MEVIINDKYKIETDKHCFMVSRYAKRRDRRTGDESWKWGDQKYFGKFEHLLNHLLECEIRDQDKTDIRELIDVIKSTESTLMSTVNELGITLKKYNEHKSSLKEIEETDESEVIV